jgi:hypothetical protein
MRLLALCIAPLILASCAQRTTSTASVERVGAISELTAAAIANLATHRSGALEDKVPFLDTWAAADGYEGPETDYKFDVVILDLDAALMGLGYLYFRDTDISPRRSDSPIADQAIGFAMNRNAGEVLYRKRVHTDYPVLDIKWDRTRWDTTRHFFYESAWFKYYAPDDPWMRHFFNHGDDLPNVEENTEVVKVRLRMSPLGHGTTSVQVDSDIVTLHLSPWETDNSEWTEPDPHSEAQDPRTIEIERRTRSATLATTQRVAVETLADGETAAYQLAQFDIGEREYRRLLFVRMLRSPQH